MYHSPPGKTGALVSEVGMGCNRLGMAHHFCLTPRAMSAIMPDARTLGQLQEDVSASNNLGPLAETRRQIERVRQTWGS